MAALKPTSYLSQGPHFVRLTQAEIPGPLDGGLILLLLGTDLSTRPFVSLCRRRHNSGVRQTS